MSNQRISYKVYINGSYFNCVRVLKKHESQYYEDEYEQLFGVPLPMISILWQPVELSPAGIFYRQ